MQPPTPRCLPYPHAPYPTSLHTCAHSPAAARPRARQPRPALRAAAAGCQCGARAPLLPRAPATRGAAGAGAGAGLQGAGAGVACGRLMSFMRGTEWITEEGTLGQPKPAYGLGARWGPVPFWDCICGLGRRCTELRLCSHGLGRVWIGVLVCGPANSDRCKPSLLGSGVSTSSLAVQHTSRASCRWRCLLEALGTCTRGVFCSTHALQVTVRDTRAPEPAVAQLTAGLTVEEVREWLQVRRSKAWGRVGGDIPVHISLKAAGWGPGKRARGDARQLVVAFRVCPVCGWPC